MRVEIGCLSLEPVGAADVVVVEDRKVLAARHVKKTVAGRRYAEVALVGRVDYARIGELADDAFARIGRAVVQDDKLEVAKRLAEHARDHLPQETRFGLVDRDKHADFRLLLHSPSLQPDYAFSAKTGQCAASQSLNV